MVRMMLSGPRGKDRTWPGDRKLSAWPNISLVPLLMLVDQLGRLLNRNWPGDIAVIQHGLGHFFITLMEGTDVVFRQVFDPDQTIVRPPLRRNQFVELELNGQGILVLRTLNQKDHQE